MPDLANLFARLISGFVKRYRLLISARRHSQDASDSPEVERERHATIYLQRIVAITGALRVGRGYDLEVRENGLRGRRADMSCASRVLDTRRSPGTKPASIASKMIGKLTVSKQDVRLAGLAGSCPRERHTYSIRRLVVCLWPVLPAVRIDSRFREYRQVVSMCDDLQRLLS
jgi:hypothetical protein